MSVYDLKCLEKDIVPPILLANIRIGPPDFSSKFKGAAIGIPMERNIKFKRVK